MPTSAAPIPAPAAALRRAGDPTARALGRLLLPGQPGIDSMVALGDGVRRRLQVADPVERRRLRLLLALALADMRRDLAALESRRDDLAHRLDALNRHRAAAVRYRRLAPAYGGGRRQPLLRGRV